MMRGAIVYDSNYGNTEKIAQALTKGLATNGGEIHCQKIDRVNVKTLEDYDFIAVGGPTHMIRPSEAMKEFLERLETIDFRGKKGFAFDTRNPSRMNGRSWMMLENSAARVIENRLKRMKVDVVRSRRSALVEGREGPLHEGMEETFAKIGMEIAELV